MPLMIAIQYAVLIGCVGILLGLIYFCGRYSSLHLTPQLEKTAKLLRSIQNQVPPVPSPKYSPTQEENSKLHETYDSKHLPIDLALPRNPDTSKLALNKLEI